jgi:cell division protein FtsI/penicillin-binding protein 2
LNGDRYRELATQVNTTKKAVPELRAAIRDRFDRALACDRASYDLAIRQKDLPLATVTLEEVRDARTRARSAAERKVAFAGLCNRLTFDPWVQRLSRETRRRPEEIAEGLLGALDRVARKWAWPSAEVTFLRDIDQPVWTMLRARQEDRFLDPMFASGASDEGTAIPGLCCTHSVRRAYPNGPTLAHLLGGLSEMSPDHLQQLREHAELIDRRKERTRIWIKFREGLDETRARKIAETLGHDPRRIDDVATLMKTLRPLPIAQQQVLVRLGMADFVRWSARPSRVTLCEAERIWLGYRMRDNPRPRATLPNRDIGISGLEGWYNQRLRGKHGLDLGRGAEVWLASHPTWREAIRPKRGDDLRLTIALEWQVACEEALRSCGKPSAMVVLDCHTGEVLALASFPTFDPNLFSPPREGESRCKQIEKLLQDPAKPLLNRAVAERYPLGSVMKVFIAATALDLNLVSPSQSHYCSGYSQLGRIRYHCDGHRAHGQVELIEAIRRSCNVYFYWLGARVGVDRLAAYAEAVGFGRRTGLDIPGEVTGIFPDRAWRNRHFGAGSPEASWSRGKDYHLAIGQGYLNVTPLQAAVLLATIANGGYQVRPRLWLDAPVEMQRRRIFSARAVSLVRQGLDEVCNVGTPGARGTGYRAFHTGEPLAVRVAGKTGTADVAGDKPAHAWFAGYAPSRSPQVAFCVFVEGGGHGGQTAAPLAYRVLKDIYGTRSAPRSDVVVRTSSSAPWRPAGRRDVCPTSESRADVIELPMVAEQ